MSLAVEKPEKSGLFFLRFLIGSVTGYIHFPKKYSEA